MAFSGSEPTPGPARADALDTAAAAAVKIAVVGSLGVGKTTLVTSVSEIRPLTTEETMTRAGAGVDDVSRVASKTSTTVAMDFGRISLDERLVLYLFGTPGQERFWFLWDGLVEGALGAVVLADARRLAECFDVLDRLEKRGVPFIVAVNDFPDAPVHSVDRLRRALDLPESVPILHCDARVRASSRDVLLTLTRYLLALSRQAALHPPALDGAEGVPAAVTAGTPSNSTADSPADLPAAAASGFAVVSYRDLTLDPVETFRGD